MTEKKNFKERVWTEDIEGELDENGFFYTPNGSFWDSDYVYFNRDGFDKHGKKILNIGGRYNDALEYIPGPGWDSNKFCYQDENSQSLPNIDDLLLDDYDGEEDDYYDPNDELNCGYEDELDDYELDYPGHKEDNRQYEVVSEKKTVVYSEQKEEKRSDVKSLTGNFKPLDGPKDPEIKLSSETEERSATKKSKLHSLFGDEKPEPKKKVDEKKPSVQDSKSKEQETNQEKRDNTNKNDTVINKTTTTNPQWESNISNYQENHYQNTKTNMNYQNSKPYNKGNKFDKNIQQPNNYYTNPNQMAYTQNSQYIPNFNMNNQFQNFPMNGMPYNNMQMNPNYNTNRNPNNMYAYMNQMMQPQDSYQQGDSRYNVNNSNKSQWR